MKRRGEPIKSRQRPLRENLRPCRTSRSRQPIRVKRAPFPNGPSSPRPFAFATKSTANLSPPSPASICGRTPADPHHLRFAQPRALGRKVSDEFTVPVCRLHHGELHRRGDEAAWWREAAIDPCRSPSRSGDNRGKVRLWARRSHGFAAEIYSAIGPAAPNVDVAELASDAPADV